MVQRLELCGRCLGDIACRGNGLRLDFRLKGYPVVESCNKEACENSSRTVPKVYRGPIDTIIELMLANPIAGNPSEGEALNSK